MPGRRSASSPPRSTWRGWKRRAAPCPPCGTTAASGRRARPCARPGNSVGIVALERYAVLKGRPVDRRLAGDGSDHYHIRVDDGARDHRIAINVHGSSWPSLVEYVLDTDFDHVLTAQVAVLPPG